jgi:hypothetical protein
MDPHCINEFTAMLAQAAVIGRINSDMIDLIGCQGTQY